MPARRHAWTGLLRTGFHRPELSGRNMVITAMALFLVVILASPLQTYLNRRDSVSDSRRQQQELKANIQQLQEESERWKDPAFVERQARARLQYVLPGDTLYTVLNPDGTSRSSDSANPAPVTRVGHQPAWNSVLWSSVVDADSQ